MGVTALAVIMVVAPAFFVGERLLSSRSKSAVPPSYGEPLDRWHSISVDGQSLSNEKVMDGHLGVLLYAHQAPGAPLVRYLQVLQDRYYDLEGGIRVVLVLGPDHVERAEAENMAGRVRYPIIYDSQRLLSRRLGLSPHMDHSFLVGNDGRIVLSTGDLLGRHELRQHVEKHLLGVIEYAPSPISLLGPAATLPACDVVGVGATGERTRQSYAPRPGTSVVVLPAELCAACSQARLHERVADLYADECPGVSDRCRIELLVTAGYSLDELRSHLHRRGLGRPRVFQALGTLTGLEDEYFTRGQQAKPDALVLLVGLESQVVDVSTLSQKEATRVHDQQ